MQFKKFLGLAALALSLVGCGGGGGGGSAAPVASTQTFDIWQAWTSYASTASTRSFSLSGTVSGTSFTGTGTSTSGSLSATTFEGRAALQRTTIATGTLQGGGSSAPYSVSETTYIDSNYLPLGYSGEEYGVTTGAVTIPRTGRVNDTGVLFTYNRYSSASKLTRLGTTTFSFALQPDTADTVLLKIIATDRSTTGTVSSTETLTFRMTASGGLTPLTDEYQDGSSALTLRY